MDEGDDACVRVGLERVLELGRVDRAAPGVLDDDRGAAGALHVLLYAPAEHAVDADHHLVARLHQVDEAGLHARRARRRDRKRELVLGAEGVAQELFELVHHGYELGIQMADGRAREGVEHTWVHIGGSGTHKGTNCGVESADGHEGI